MMKKERYERTALEIIAFSAEDVIVTSGTPQDEYEDTILKPNR